LTIFDFRFKTNRNKNKPERGKGRPKVAAEFFLCARCVFAVIFEEKLMTFVSILHQGLGNTTWMFFLALGLWGLYRAIRGQSVDSSYLGAAAIGQLLFVVQVIVGGILWLNGRSTTMVRPDVHALYGGFVLVFLPFIYVVTLRGDTSNRGQWVLAFSTLFLFGVALRLITTGL
jgi:hypothetical protein